MAVAKKKSSTSKYTNGKWFQTLTSKSVLALVVIAVFSIGGAVYLGSSHAATPCKSRTFAKGSSGTCVSNIQYILNGEKDYFDYNYRSKLTPIQNVPYLNVDGTYGSKTVSFVINIQETQNSLGIIVPMKVDGIVGSQTWGLLCGAAGKNNYLGMGSTVRMHQAYVAAINAGCTPQP